MFVYQYLNIENHQAISESIKKYLIDHTSVFEEKLMWKFLDVNQLISHVPEIEKIFSAFDLKISIAAAVYRKPFSQGGIHIDTSEFYRVLFPVMNCQGSKTKFFEYDETKFRAGGGGDGDKNLTLIQGQQLKFLDEFELSRPVIFNPKIPHGVYSNPVCKEPRVSITFGFNKDPRNILTS